MFNYGAAIWKCRYFWLNLVRMDLRTRYRRSVLGMGWSLLHPIAMTVILCVVFSKLLTPQGDVWDYAPFLLTGLATWSYIVHGASQGCFCLYQGESYIRQYPAPLAIYPLRVALGAGIHFLMALSVVLALSWITKGFGNLVALPSLIPSLALFFVLAWSLAVLTGFATVYFQDTQHLTEVGFQFLFYMTPIIYEPSLLRDRNLGWLVDCNPLVAFLDLVRIPVLQAHWPSLTTYATAGGLAFGLAGLAGLVLAKCQRRLIFSL